METPPVGDEFFHSDGWTGRNDETNSRFSQFKNKGLRMLLFLIRCNRRTYAHDNYLPTVGSFKHRQLHCVMNVRTAPCIDMALIRWVPISILVRIYGYPGSWLPIVRLINSHCLSGVKCHTHSPAMVHNTRSRYGVVKYLVMRTCTSSRSGQKITSD